MNNNENLAKIAINKSLLKEYSNSSNERIIYMDNGTEFQIQIFNPNTFVIGVAFNFNEEYSWNYSNLLVLRPGERIWLDRYLNENKKLLFSTYEVGNSQQIQEAIRNNGKLEIKFFKEYQKKDWGNNILISQVLNSNFNDYTPQKVWYGYDNLQSSVNTLDLNDNSITCNYCSTVTGADTVSLGFASTAATTATYSTGNSKKRSMSKSLKNNSIETGRIEKGGYSNQSFKTVNMDFESRPFRTETIHIYPASQKPITKADLNKKYCYNCGKKITEKFKYCPNCGAKQ